MGMEQRMRDEIYREFDSSDVSKRAEAICDAAMITSRSRVRMLMRNMPDIVTGFDLGRVDIDDALTGSSIVKKV